MKNQWILLVASATATDQNDNRNIWDSEVFLLRAQILSFLLTKVTERTEVTTTFV